MGTYLPPEWPAGVHPPGSEDFESTAVGWLLDVVPPDYRLHGVLRRYPVALATMARYHAKACVEGARQGYRTARTELAGALPPHAIDTVLAAYRKEGARLAAVASAVGLVERALRGEVFTPGMDFAEPPETAGPEGNDRGAAARDADAAGAQEASAAGAQEASRTRKSGRARETGGAREAETAGSREAETAGSRGAETARSREAETAGSRGAGRRQPARTRKGG
jgi:hypothetical protein